VHRRDRRCCIGNAQDDRIVVRVLRLGDRREICS
jgi:hypothetical protein